MQIRAANYLENKEITLNELNNYTKETVPALQHEQIDISFIYQEGDQILGRIVGFIHWNYLQIELFFVAKDTQGQGVGTKLLAHVEKIAREKQLAYILLETMSFNAPRFYEKNGFSILSTIQNSPLKNQHRHFYIKAFSEN